MADVKILTGPPLDTPLNEINDKSTAAMHAGLRAGDVFHALHADCRPLAHLLDEAESAGWLGEPDRDAFIGNVLGLPLGRIELALEGLRWFDLTKPVPFELAVIKGAAAEVMARAVPLAMHGTNQHSVSVAEAMAKVDPLKAHGGGEVGRANGTSSRGSNQAAYLASRIKRDHPDIAAAVERGEYRSMRKAAIAAGIVKEPTKLDRLNAAWNACSEEDRRTFLAAIMRPELDTGKSDG